MNGKKIEKIVFSDFMGKLLCFEIDFPIENGLRYFSENDIKSIITHEQFEQMKYKVEE